MRLFFSILGILVASILLFTGLATAESWKIFGPYFAGESAAPAVPPTTEVEAALRAYNRGVEAGANPALERSTAWKMIEADRSFRARYGVTQQLALSELRVEEVRSVGPEVYRATTEERSQLTIARTLTPPRHYRVVGTWEYRLARRDGSLLVIDVKPSDVQLEPLDGPTPGTP